MEQYSVNRIVIVGGGTAGWMTAARLAKHFRRTSIKIRLVESSEIGTVGVGEATIPTLREFYRELDLTDDEVMRATQATCKLGIQFENWHLPDSAFIHPFGLFGQKANGIDFHHYWLKLHRAGDTSELADYSLGVQLAKHHRFVTPSPNPPSELSVFDWALHFDAAAFGRLMRDCAERQGVERIDAKIEEVLQNPETGFIETLKLNNGDTVAGDLFIDCSGFRALLMEQTLKTGYCDWSEWLRCDRAVAVQSERVGDAPPYTVSLASGFLEPLESTSIALVETAIHKIRHAFQRPWYTETQVDEFNELTAQEYERVRDFIILHYKLNGRTDSDFWRECREMSVPDTLARKIDAYTQQGELLRYPVEIFGPASWLAIFSGFGVYPKHYHPAVDKLDAGYLQQALGAMRQSIADAVAQAPTHEEYLANLT